MTATSHALIGTTIAAVFPNPLIAIPVALMFHVACDLVPHWDAGTHFDKKDSNQLFLEALLDVVTSFVATGLFLLVIFPHVNVFYGYFIAFMSQFLDYLVAPYYMLHMTFPPFNWLFAFSKKTNVKLDKPWGIVTQASVVLALTIIAKII